MFALEFETFNAAFDTLEHETARILFAIARSVEHGETHGKVRDINGNTIGKWELTP